MEERLNYIKLFLNDLFYRFGKDKCSSVAAELTITSLLALVPLTTLVFALLALVPNFDKKALQLQQFIFAYFIPTSGESIQSYLVEFVGKARSISGIGFFMLFITALMMMRTIDKSFNHIWKIKKKTSKVRTFLVYWAVLTLGPIALGASIAISSYINSLPVINEVVAENSVWFKNILPFLMASLAFTLMYYVIPNRKILILNALSSAFVAALLFEVAKSLFGLFVRYFSTYELVFGALAAIPLFLIWIYVSWNIVLFGAEFCFGLSNQNNHNSKTIKTNRVIRRLLLLNQLIQSQNKDEQFVYNPLNQNEDIQYSFSKEDIDELKNEGYVVEISDQNYCLIGNAENLNYTAIFKPIIEQFPTEEALKDLRVSTKLNSELIKIIQNFKYSLNTKLVISG